MDEAIEQRPAETTKFPKQAAQVFNPGRNKYRGKIGGENRYAKHWKRGFFRLYGKKGFNNPFVFDPYVQAVFELSCLRDGDTNPRKYSPDQKIRANIGGLDFLNPLVPLSLLCIILSRAMSLKGDDLKDVGKTGRYAALKILQGVFNTLLTVPLTAVALLTTFLWDAVKATVAAVTTTFSSMVTAPIEAARTPSAYSQF